MPLRKFAALVRPSSGDSKLSSCSIAAGCSDRVVLDLIDSGARFYEIVGMVEQVEGLASKLSAFLHRASSWSKEKVCTQLV